MKLLPALTLVLVGCASGGQSQPNETPDGPTHSQPDAPVGSHDAPIPMVDAATVDSPATSIDAAPDACVKVNTEKLVNPALDLAPNGTGWTEVLIQNLPGGPYPIITADGFAPASAPNKAWMGGAAGSDASPAAATLTDQLFQDVTFPADATTFVVSGMAAVGTTDVTTVVFDTFTLDVTETNGTPIENVIQLNNTSPTGVFNAFSKTLAANLAGRTVRLRATSTNDSSFNSNFFLDNLSFKATFCP